MITKLEKECKDMADVCELAHDRTVRECRKEKIPVNCKSADDCHDEGQDHGTAIEMTHYTGRAQTIFDRHYDHINNVTGL